MSELPEDLIPLPTMPYEKRPEALPLDIEECRTALWLCRGNISEAAKKLKVHPSRLRSFIRNSPRLTEEANEAREQLVDMAEDIAYEALTDPEDSSRRDTMARFVMSNLGKSRGYGNAASKVDVNLGSKGSITISWADGSSLSASSGDEAEPKTIEHNEAAE